MVCSLGERNTDLVNKLACMESNWASERDILRDEAAREATATAAMRLKLESDLATAQHSLYQESQVSYLFGAGIRSDSDLL